MPKILATLCVALVAIWGSPQVAAQVPLTSMVHIESGTGHGSGVVVKEGDESLILTANHVVKMGELKVNGESAEIVLQDEKRDLAVIKVKQRLPAITISEEHASLGSPIIVIGCPYGRCFSVTQGFIGSGVDEDGHTMISATAYPGNSGGPVLWYSSLRRQWVLAGVVIGIYARREMMSMNMITSITYARMDFMEVLKGLVKVAKLDDRT